MRTPDEQAEFLEHGRFSDYGQEPRPENLIIVAIAAVIFAASFFLPSVEFPPGTSSLAGYVCAEYALMSPLFIPSGLINPLLLAYTFSTMAGARKAAFSIAVIIGVFLVYTPVVLLYNKVALDIGFFAWEAGAFMIVFQKIFTEFPKTNVRN